MANNEKRSSVERFISSEDYQKAAWSAFPDNKCRDCSFLFTFKNKTRCYCYEQRRCNDKVLEFNPRRDFNCDMFDTTGLCAIEIHYFLQALKKGVHPSDDAEYIKALEEANAHADAMSKMKDRQRALECACKKDWDDPNTYANCSAWKEEPGDCTQCADDECPMNRS